VATDFQKTLSRGRAERRRGGKPLLRGVQDFWNDLRRHWVILVLALPGIGLIFLFRYVPMFGLVVAFEEFHADTRFFSPWVGLRNFRLLFGSPVLFQIVRNTLVLNSLFIVATTLCSVTIALLLNEVRVNLFKGIAQSLMFLPFFMGWAVVAMVMYGFLDYEVGTVNMVLRSMGREKIAFGSDPKAWPWILTLIRIWKGTGSGCILYLAALAGINPELYEAAEIDGANRFQKIRYISLPLLVSVVILVTLLAIGRIFYGDFGMIYAIVGNNSLLYETTDVIDTYIIRALQTTTNFGMSTAVGFSQSVVGFITVFGSNWLVRLYSRRQGENYALF
jgi:putative aldouronate transport system permease protein